MKNNSKLDIIKILIIVILGGCKNENNSFENSTNHIVKFIDNKLNKGEILLEFKTVGDYLDSCKKNNKLTDKENLILLNKVYEVLNKDLKSYYSYDKHILNNNYISQNSYFSNLSIKRSKWGVNYDSLSINEGILPYKIHLEKPIMWRKQVLNDYKYLLDTIYSFNDPLKAAFLINEIIRKNWIHAWGLKQLGEYTDYDWLSRYKMGICEHRLMYSLFVLRGLGIASYLDFCPQWGNKSGGHSWISVVDTNNKTIAFNFGEDSHLPLKNEIPMFKATGAKAPKIYRNTYENFKDTITSKKGENDIIPDVYVCNFNIKDVTKEYFKPNRITIDLNHKNIILNHNIVYLCVFDNLNWVPVDWAVLDTKKITFKNIGCEIVYLPMIYNGEFIPISEPFLLDSNGKATKFIPQKNYISKISLSRKYPLFPRIDMFYNQIIGGVFEASNDSEFKTKDLLYTIKKYPNDGWNYQKIFSNKAYKYIRFKGSENSSSNISEILFLDKDNNKISGKPISSKFAIYHDSIMAFDDNVLTYFESVDKDNGWVGLKFNKPTLINEIAYLPRTDANFIYQKKYKVYYWDYKWIELPNLVSGNNLIVTNVPQNSLLFVRQFDIEKERWDGVEQRIFSFSANKIYWW